LRLSGIRVRLYNLLGAQLEGNQQTGRFMPTISNARRSSDFSGSQKMCITGNNKFVKILKGS